MRPKKLFHAIVVVGATLAGGCGDDSAGEDAAVADASMMDAGVRVADAAMDAAGEAEDAGDEDAMVLIL